MKMLNLANQFNIFCFLDNHQYNFEAPAFECLLAVGCSAKLFANAGDFAFEQVRSLQQQNSGWLFGHLGFDLKNELEDLHSDKVDNIGFSDIGFFVPQTVLELTNNSINIYTAGNAIEMYDALMACANTIDSYPATPKIAIKHKLSKESYISSVQQLQAHILQGDCYEINYCQEFFAENAVINPLLVYWQLTNLSPSPFAALYKLDDKFCISASPERYIKKVGNTLISQPIKGTAIRNMNNAEMDHYNKELLQNSEKEKSENVMVVDLVRNDLSKICKEGSVKVEELFGVYSFPQVHQMISTISGELADGLDWIEVIKATFPMGSMTGAPKKKVMQLIDRYEYSKRGLYSGAIGYLNPNGNFDFNVVIRSILYNATNRYVSFQTGSAITFASNPEHEYEECLLKAAAIRQVLNNTNQV